MFHMLALLRAVAILECWQLSGMRVSADIAIETGASTIRCKLFLRNFERKQWQSIVTLQLKKVNLPHMLKEIVAKDMVHAT